MKFHSIFLMIFLGFLISCKSYYKEPHEIEYNCVLEQSQFLVSIQPILTDEGFIVSKVDDYRGYIVAEKNIKNSKNEDVVLNLSIRFEKDSKKYFAVPSALILPREKNSVEYYTEKKIRKEYRTHFTEILNRLKYFCKGGYYPNRP